MMSPLAAEMQNADPATSVSRAPAGPRVALSPTNVSGCATGCLSSRHALALIVDEGPVEAHVTLDHAFDREPRYGCGSTCAAVDVLDGLHGVGQPLDSGPDEPRDTVVDDLGGGAPRRGDDRCA